jgi:hypothetical protein
MMMIYAIPQTIAQIPPTRYNHFASGSTALTIIFSFSKHYLATFFEELVIATTALLISRRKAVGAQIARSPALGVIKLRTRLKAANATTTHTSQRDTRDHAGKTSPARASVTMAIPARSAA